MTFKSDQAQLERGPQQIPCLHFGFACSIFFAAPKRFLFLCHYAKEAPDLLADKTHQELPSALSYVLFRPVADKVTVILV